MELVDGMLVAISAVMVLVSSTVICAINYRRCFPARKQEEVVVVQPPDW